MTQIENDVPEEDIEDALDTDLDHLAAALDLPLPELHRASLAGCKSHAAKKCKAASNAAVSARSRTVPPPAAPRARRAAAAVKPGVYRDLTNAEWAAGCSDSEPEGPFQPTVVAPHPEAPESGGSRSADAKSARQSADRAVSKGPQHRHASDDEGSSIQPSVSNTSTASKRKRRERKRGSGASAAARAASPQAPSVQCTSSRASQSAVAPLRSKDSDSGDDSDASCAQSRKHPKPTENPLSTRGSDCVKSKVARGAEKNTSSHAAARELAVKKGATKRRQAVKECKDVSGVPTGSQENRTTANVRSLVQGFETMGFGVQLQAEVGKERAGRQVGRKRNDSAAP